MDIKCRICGEPWNVDTIHEFVSERYLDEPWMVENEDGEREHNQSIYEIYYNEVKQDFYKNGCEAFDAQHNDHGKASPEWDAMYELMGDDLDGVAAMMEDMGY